MHLLFSSAFKGWPLSYDGSGAQQDLRWQNEITKEFPELQILRKANTPVFPFYNTPYPIWRQEAETILLTAPLCQDKPSSFLTAAFAINAKNLIKYYNFSVCLKISGFDSYKETESIRSPSHPYKETDNI